VEFSAADKEIVKQFLQDTDIHITVDRHSSQRHIDADMLTIPAEITDNMVVAVTPAKKSGEKYWIAQVLGKKEDNPVVYSLRYYDYSKQKKGWVLMKENNAYGTCPHSAILYAGIEFNLNNTMKAHCLEHLQAITE
jgi:hypothetical protein